MLKMKSTYAIGVGHIPVLNFSGWCCDGEGSNAEDGKDRELHFDLLMEAFELALCLRLEQEKSLRKR